MKTTDEELQKKIESGDLLDKSSDSEAYRSVFNALQKELHFELPPSFSERVIQRIAESQARRESIYDRFVLATGLVAFAGALIFCLTQISFKPGVGVFTFLSGYSGLVVFGIAFVLLLHFVDKRLLKKVHP